MKRLSGKTAIITGGARGIGKATAAKFLMEGAAVALWDIDETAGVATTVELKSIGGNIRFYKVNTTDLNTVTEGAEQVKTDFGHIDILLNNSGFTRDASMKKMSLQQWQLVIDYREQRNSEEDRL